MPRVVCPVCRTGFEANITRDNFALNCVACGVAFNAAAFLSKNDFAKPEKSKNDSGSFPPPAHASTRTGGLPFMSDSDDSAKIKESNGAAGKTPELTPLPRRKLPIAHPLAAQRPPSSPALKAVDVPAMIGLPTPAPALPPSESSVPKTNPGSFVSAPPALSIVRPTPAPEALPAAPEKTEEAPVASVEVAAPMPVAAPAPVPVEKPVVRAAEPAKKKNRRPLLEGSFGPYDIEGEIARGGVGAVFKARERDGGRQVALKVLLDGEEAGETERERFRHECETAKALALPGMVQVYAVGELDQRPYMAMELVNGRSLDKIIPERSLSVNDCLVLMKSVAETIGALHEAGYVHRDLKPGNILIDEFGSPKVADFGLVKSLDEITRLTASGLVCGTPAYMAPEQARGDGKAVDPRSDVWALGAVLYEMLASRPPFQAENALRLMLKITKDQPTPLRQLNLKVPRDVSEIVTRCLEKTPERRYATARSMAQDIARFLNGEPLENATQPKVQQIMNAAVRFRRPLGMLAGTIGVIVVIALSAKLFFGPKDPRVLVNKGQAMLVDRSIAAADRLANAQKLFREATVLDPKNARAYLLLGSCMGQEALSAKTVDRAKYDLARASLHHAAELDAQMLPDCYAAQSVFDRMLKRYDDEVKDLEEALKYAPNNSKYRESLAMAYWWTNDYPKALREFESVLNADRENPRVRAYIKQLKEQLLNQTVARK